MFQETNAELHCLFSPSLRCYLLLLPQLPLGNKQVSSPPRFKEEEHRPHLLRGMSRSFCRRAGWVGNIVATIFGKYNLPQPLRTKQHPSLWIYDFVNFRVQWSISVSGRARKQNKTCISWPRVSFFSPLSAQCVLAGTKRKISAYKHSWYKMTTEQVCTWTVLTEHNNFTLQIHAFDYRFIQNLF